MSYVVEVNEINVYTYGPNIKAAADWWLWFRRGNPASRFTEHSGTPVGFMVDVACDTKADAEWLAEHMVSFGGLNKAAVRVKRAAAVKP